MFYLFLIVLLLQSIFWWIFRSPQYEVVSLLFLAQFTNRDRIYVVETKEEHFYSLGGNHFFKTLRVETRDLHKLPPGLFGNCSVAD